MTDASEARAEIEAAIKDLMSLVFEGARLDAENKIDEALDAAVTSGLVSAEDLGEMDVARALIASGVTFGLSALLVELERRKMIDMDQVLVQALTL